MSSDEREPGAPDRGATAPGSAAVEFEEVVVAGRSPRSATPGGGRRRPAGPGPAVRAGLLVGGLAVAIVGVGLFGSRPPAPPEAPSPSPVVDAAPRTLSPDVAVTAPAPIPRFRRSGEPLADPQVLVAGRWMDLASGRAVAGAPDGCAGQRIHVLGSGRVVCVISNPTRTPGSRIALYDLGVTTVGSVRVDPAAPAPAAGAPAGAPAGDAEPQALATLLGQRDVVIGDPVAIAVAPGPGSDDLVLAWAAVGERGYEIGLEAFRLGDAGPRAERLGDWIVGRAPSTGPDAVETLGDLAVAVDPGAGGTALVGWTEAGRGIPGPVRRLAVVAIDGSTPPVMLRPAATRNLAPEAADGPLRTGTACGGPFGEGFAGAGSAYVVCPGSPAELRVVDLGGSWAGVSPGAVIATVPLLPEGSAPGSAALAGNGIALDAARSILYRWSPATGIIWKVELDGGGPDADDAIDDATRAAPRVSTLFLEPRGLSREASPGGDAGPALGPRPILALDAAHGRLYALEAPLPGSERAVVHLIDVETWRHFASFPVADTATRAISLSPDGRLLYASTEPRQAGGPPPVVGVAVIDARTGIEIAYAGRLRADARAPLQAVVVR
jgi:hypothetical protein